jgi:hypothetical protein
MFLAVYPARAAAALAFWSFRYSKTKRFWRKVRVCMEHLGEVGGRKGAPRERAAREDDSSARLH